MRPFLAALDENLVTRFAGGVIQVFTRRADTELKPQVSVGQGSFGTGAASAARRRWAATLAGRGGARPVPLPRRVPAHGQPH